MPRRKPLMFAVLASVVLNGPVWAEHWHEDHDHWTKHAKHHSDDDEDRDFDHHAPGCFFQPHDVGVITEYYATQARRLPPGLAKKYARTGQLPPGWQKKVRPFPSIVERELVVLPQAYRRGIVDGYAVVYDPETRGVVDVVAVFGR